MADIEKVIGQLSALDDKIKQKKAELKDLESKKIEAQSKWINDLMVKNNMNFTDIAELVTEKKAAQKETTVEKETSDSTNANYQNKHS